MAKEIPLTQGKIALIDDEDYERIIQYHWYADKHGYTYYARRSFNNKHDYLHRFIMNAKPGEQIDHLDGNGLNDQKYNLRIVNNSQNHMNSKKHLDGLNKYKGISWNKRKKKWVATICLNYKHIHLGFFINELDAARAYDEAAKKYHGEYARLNFE